MDYSAFKHRKKPEAPHIIVGRKGEETAVKFLRRLGYEIREQNIRLGKDEIDVLAFDPVDHVLVFVEVKSRRKAYIDYDPTNAYSPRKAARVRRAARRWVMDHQFEEGYRLDLISVVDNKVTEHIKELDWE